jgi:sporulation protein YlmC with PRC-barrel domain
MYVKLIAAAALGAFLSTAAFAENADHNASAKSEWQASKLIHMNVYNGQKEKIGDIKELMLDKTGKVQDVVIGVGGFLGAGEHDVAVKFDQLKWSNSSSSTTGSARSTSADNNGRTYPDHAILNATKDQLKSMPNFQYNK